MAEMSTPVDELELSVRAVNGLSTGFPNCKTLGDLSAIHPAELLRLPNFSHKTLSEIYECLSGNFDESLLSEWTSHYRMQTDYKARVAAQREVTRQVQRQAADIDAAIRGGVYSNKEPLMVAVPLCCVPHCARLSSRQINGLHCCGEHGNG
jgi:hypothetical protein